MDDLISRQMAIDALKQLQKSVSGDYTELDPLVMAGCGYIGDCIGELECLPSAQPERKRGHWTERHHAYSDEEQPIEEWQSCKCSECGRYDTRPYLYYFSEPRFCSWCGADMRGEQDG